MFYVRTPAPVIAALHACTMVLNGGKDWHRREESLNEVIIIVFFVHKSYFCNFMKLRLNH